MSKNSAIDIKDLAYTQAKSFLNSLDITSDAADDNKLRIIFDDPKVNRDLNQIKDYFEYYHQDGIANMHSFTMIFRAGMRVGTYYEIIEIDEDPNEEELNELCEIDTPYKNEKDQKRGNHNEENLLQ